MLKTFSTLALAAIVLAPAALAETISISALAFQRFDRDVVTEDPLAVNGTLEPDSSGSPTVLFALVQFPKSGRKVCKFSLVYQDNNDLEGLSAQLIRKPIVIGADALAAPTVMATLNSASGAVAAARRASTTNVSSRTINNTKNFYYVRLEAENFNTIPVGVQLDVRTTCP